MNFGFPSFVAMASVVWSNATRALTGFGSALALGGSVNQTLAASGSVSFSPGSATNRIITAGAKAGAAGTCLLQLGDGTNLFQLQSIAAGNSGGQSVSCTTTALIVFIKNNDGANAVTYSFVVADMVI